MNLSDVALIASVAVLIVAIVDWRRGKTGLLNLQLTKEKTPDKFWYAIVLYINIAIGLLWLSGMGGEPETQCGGADNPCDIVVEGAVA